MILTRILAVGLGSAFLFAFAVACGDGMGEAAVGGRAEKSQVLTDTSFLADIVSNVAGDRLVVSALVPEGADPHSFEPSPRDARRLGESHAMVINAPGLMPVVDELIAGAGGADVLVMVASEGVPGVDKDPHCWLDPLSVVAYAENIADGLAALDPAGAEDYAANAAAYAKALRELDSWISAQIETIPAERRLLVTNHESFGRFAARYGFDIVGTVFPTATGEGSPSARQLADLVESIRATGAPAIFLETGSSVELARQVAAEAGVEVVTDLYTHSLGKDAATYLEMMRWNVVKIAGALR